MLKLLLRYNQVNVNVKDKQGLTPLHYACSRNHAKIVELLMQIPRIDCNVKDNKDWSPLNLATVENHDKVVQMLMDCDGIDCNAKNSLGWAPLHYASQDSLTKVLGSLLQCDGIECNAKTQNGTWTALHLAAFYNNLKVTKMLLKNKDIDVHIKDSRLRYADERTTNEERQQLKTTASKRNGKGTERHSSRKCALRQ